MGRWIGLISTIIIVILVASLSLGLFNFCINIFNDMVVAQENTHKAIGIMETEMQRRWDLIPNLVSSVKGYMKHEETTLTKVIEARASASRVNVSVKNVKEIATQEENLGKALGRLLIAIEKYPKLLADTHITKLMNDLKETENYIAQARINYNDITQKYNSFIRKFPQNILANIFGFTKIEYIELINKEAKYAPKVKF